MCFVPVRTTPPVPPLVPPAPPPATDFCSHDNFWTTFSLDFFHFWHDCWPWPVDYLIRFWPIFVVTLILNFQDQIWNLLYLSQKWSDCHKTKSKHIDWIQGLKWDHRVWPWLWSWSWIFKVKYGIYYISTKSGPITTKRKANISILIQASNVTNGFDLGHELELWIFKVKCDWHVTIHMAWTRIFMVKFWNSFISDGRANWHWTKGVGVGHSWPWLWPFGDQGQM